MYKFTQLAKAEVGLTPSLFHTKALLLSPKNAEALVLSPLSISINIMPSSGTPVRTEGNDVMESISILSGSLQKNHSTNGGDYCGITDHTLLKILSSWLPRSYDLLVFLLLL